MIIFSGDLAFGIERLMMICGDQGLHRRAKTCLLNAE